MKFFARPILVDAFQWNGEYPLPPPLECNWNNDPRTSSSVSFNTPSGHVYVDKGDWIITDIMGNVELCKPEVFPMAYVRAEQDS